MRQTIPQEYFDLFAYMKTQDPATRIANFPQFSFWGWGHYDWGYRGSGFLWYGLRQPLMDRAFDVWDKNSEHYYEEMSTALYSGNQVDFETVLDKYSLNWLLVDEYVSLAENATDSGLITLKQFLGNSKKFTLDKQFGDRISLYKVSLPDSPQNFLSAGSATSTQYPFTSLSLRPNTDWTKKGNYLNLGLPVSAQAGDTITIPSLSDTEALLPVEIEYRKLGNSLDIRLTPIIPTIFLDNNQIDLQADSISVSIPGTVGSGFILELNQNYFELQLPAELESFSDFYPLTTVYLPTQKSFTASLYSSSESVSYDLTNNLSQATPDQCYTIKPNRKVEKLITANSVSLIGTDVTGCLSAPLPFISKGSLISLSFSYSSPTLTTGNVNISGKNLLAINLPQSLQSSEKTTRTRLFAKSTGSYQQVNLLLEAGETKSPKEIDYSDIQAAVLPQIYSASVALPHISEKQITLKGDLQRIQISLPDTDTQFDLKETPDSNTLFPENLNCDQWNDGLTVKQITSDGILYQSQNADECDILNLRHLPHSLNYLFAFDYRFQKGLATTICLENFTSRRCDIQERLAKTKEVQYVIQPVANPEESAGYTLHLANQSFGRAITSNLLKSISIRPVPLHFLQSIGIGAASTPSQAVLNSSTHPYSFLYTLSVTADKGSILNLYQTRSSSWKAFSVASRDIQMSSWLLALASPLTAPFLTKLTPTNSSWHNSWILPEGMSNIVILYLPQYLEFLGLTVLILIPLIAIVIALCRRHKK